MTAALPEMTMWLPESGPSLIDPAAFLKDAAKAHLADVEHASHGQHQFHVLRCPCEASHVVVCDECDADVGAVVGPGCSHLDDRVGSS